MSDLIHKSVSHLYPPPRTPLMTGRQNLIGGVPVNASQHISEVINALGTVTLLLNNIRAHTRLE
jgi:hypothetical protein